MIANATLSFLEQLKQNNDKNWFDEHRKEYETARENILALSSCILKDLCKLDDAFSQVQPKDTIFRINRDVRFSNNKDPYKTNIGAYFSAQGKKAMHPGYYVHIEPGQSFAAAGLWMPDAQALAAIRQEIDYNLTSFQIILQAPSFRSNFPNGLADNESLKRPPKGYDEANPAIDFLKLKNFVVTKKYTDQQVVSKNFLKDLTNTYRVATPLIEFLKQALH